MCGGKRNEAGKVINGKFNLLRKQFVSCSWKIGTFPRRGQNLKFAYHRVRSFVQGIPRSRFCRFWKQTSSDAVTLVGDSFVLVLSGQGIFPPRRKFCKRRIVFFDYRGFTIRIKVLMRAIFTLRFASGNFFICNFI